MRMSRSLLLIGTAVVCVAIVVCGVRYTEMKDGRSLRSLSRCFATPSAYAAPNASCLTSTLHDLLPAHSAAEILAYASASTSARALASNCHSIGHIIGESLARQEGSIESALAACSPICGSGCLHGVIAESMSSAPGLAATEDLVHADDEIIRGAGSKYCDASGQLCHGIGHVLFLATSDVSKSLSVCEKMASGTRRDSCFRGVFMESFGSDLSVKFHEPSVHTDANDYLYPCSTYAAPYQRACFAFLTGLHLNETSAVSPEYIREEGARACGTLSGLARSYCFNGLGNDGAVIQENLEDYAQVERLCLGLSDRLDRVSCVSGMLEKYINYGKGIEAGTLCTKVSAEERNECLEALKAARSRGE